MEVEFSWSSCPLDIAALVLYTSFTGSLTSQPVSFSSWKAYLTKFNSFIAQVYCDKFKQELCSGSAHLWDMIILVVVKEFEEPTAIK